MAERAPILGSSMIPRKGTAALQPVEPALEQNNSPVASPVSGVVSQPEPIQAGRRGIEPAPRRVLRQPLSYRPSVEDHDWLTKTSRDTGHPIQYIIDLAIKRLREEVG